MELAIGDLTGLITKMQTKEYSDYVTKAMVAKARLALASLQEASVAHALMTEDGWAGDSKVVFSETTTTLGTANAAIKKAKAILEEADADKGKE